MSLDIVARVDRLKALVAEFPKHPGVYLMKNSREQVIYVGKAKDLRSRVRSYFVKSSDHRLKTLFLVNQIDQIEYQLTKTEVEAFLLEATLIKKFRPRYNIRLKDDKAYPYIMCTIQQKFPRFFLARKVKKDGAVYFGPYTSSLAVRQTLRFVTHTFQIRDCSDHFMHSRKRPCMTHQIGRCSAPCVDLVTEDKYRKDIQSALSFLRGEQSKVLLELEKQMKSSAELERFEQAARLRDAIKSVERILDSQAVVSLDQEFDQDVVAYFGDERGTVVETLHIRRGRVIGSKPHFLPRLNLLDAETEVLDWLISFLNQYYLDNVVPDEILLPIDIGPDMSRLLRSVLEERQGKKPEIRMNLSTEASKLMELAQKNAELHFKDQVEEREGVLDALKELQAKLHLPALPIRMECYDISHFQGAETVASQVVFEEGVAKSEDYRKYKIRTVQGVDDFASMKEVLMRRFQHQEYDDPQLIVVDGGKGQLKLALEALKESGRSDVPLVALAKARVKGEFDEQEVSSSQERVFLPGRQNPVTFRSNSKALAILTHLRDEAHRFAISFHRKLREDRSLSSVLDELQGVGPEKKKVLLKAFGSVDMLRQASIKEIAELPGFGERLAEKIKGQLG